jgi:hypothetical protein
MKVLITVLALIGCGSNVGQVRAHRKLDDMASKASRRIDVTTKAWHAKFNPKKHDSPAACAVVSQTSLTGVVIGDQAVTWGEAVNQAPAGKRIATRGEVLMLWDSGALKDVNFMVWTGTQKDSSTSYILNGDDGTLDNTDINAELNAIYVDKE